MPHTTHDRPLAEIPAESCHGKDLRTGDFFDRLNQRRKMTADRFMLADLDQRGHGPDFDLLRRDRD